MMHPAHLGSHLECLEKKEMWGASAIACRLGELCTALELRDAQAQGLPHPRATPQGYAHCCCYPGSGPDTINTKNTIRIEHKF